MKFLNFKIDVVKIVIFVMLAIGMLSFELFNYATTELGIKSLIGDGKVLSISIASVFAIAFCFADIGGIARVFTPQTSLSDEPLEVYLAMGGWIIAAIINAGMTWYALLTMMSGRALGNEIVSQEALLTYAPFIGALATLLVRFMLVNSIVIGIESKGKPVSSAKRPSMPIRRPAPTMYGSSAPKPPVFTPLRAGPKPDNNKSLANLLMEDD